MISSKIWLNDPCPCWSGKKYKKCFGVNRFQNTCCFFLNENLNENIAYVGSFINSAAEEISKAVKCLQDNCSVQTLRSQSLLIFAFIETISKLWVSYVDYKATDNDKAAFLNRFNEFISTDANIFWKENTNLKLLDWEILYKLRCKLSHGLSVPDTQIDWKIIMINNDSNHPSASILRKKIKNLITISPTELITITTKAGMLMIDKINEENKSPDFSKRIQNMANYLQKEGAELITTQ